MADWDEWRNGWKSEEKCGKVKQRRERIERWFEENYKNVKKREKKDDSDQPKKCKMSFYLYFTGHGSPLLMLPLQCRMPDLLPTHPPQILQQQQQRPLQITHRPHQVRLPEICQTSERWGTFTLDMKEAINHLPDHKASSSNFATDLLDFCRDYHPTVPELHRLLILKLDPETLQRSTWRMQKRNAWHTEWSYANEMTYREKVTGICDALREQYFQSLWTYRRSLIASSVPRNQWQITIRDWSWCSEKPVAFQSSESPNDSNEGHSSELPPRAWPWTRKRTWRKPGQFGVQCYFCNKVGH